MQLVHSMTSWLDRSQPGCQGPTRCTSHSAKLSTEQIPCLSPNSFNYLIVFILCEPKISKDSISACVLSDAQFRAQHAPVERGDFTQPIGQLCLQPRHYECISQHCMRRSQAVGLCTRDHLFKPKVRPNRPRILFIFMLLQVYSVHVDVYISMHISALYIANRRVFFSNLYKVSFLVFFVYLISLISVSYPIPFTSSYLEHVLTMILLKNC